ncbi:MAG TPA: hypothetical protein ENK16_09130 [Chromatiales bacterium]|nr:hypothetical protein [Chromatiales bacterium]
MKISLLYTSARPQMIPGVLETWKNRAADWSSIEAVVVTDEPFDGSFQNMVTYTNTGRRDCVTGWNLAASKASGDMFVQESDDLTPPMHWDRKLIALAGGAEYFSLHLPDERGLPNCVFHPVISRKVYEHFGYLYPPDFRSMYCDNWLFEAHRHAGFLKQIRASNFWHHRHRTTHAVEADEVLLRHESLERYAEGRKVLVRELAKLGIEIVFPPEDDAGS